MFRLGSKALQKRYWALHSYDPDYFLESDLPTYADDEDENSEDDLSEVSDDEYMVEDGAASHATKYDHAGSVTAESDAEQWVSAKDGSARGRGEKITWDDDHEHGENLEPTSSPNLRVKAKQTCRHLQTCYLIHAGTVPHYLLGDLAGLMARHLKVQHPWSQLRICRTHPTLIRTPPR